MSLFTHPSLCFMMRQTLALHIKTLYSFRLNCLCAHIYKYTFTRRFTPWAPTPWNVIEQMHHDSLFFSPHGKHWKSCLIKSQLHKQTAAAATPVLFGLRCQSVHIDLKVIFEKFPVHDLPHNKNAMRPKQFTPQLTRLLWRPETNFVFKLFDTIKNN